MLKKYKCPVCKSTSAVIRQRKRGDSIVYLCKTCNKYFSIKVSGKSYKDKDLLNDHLDGLSFRKLEDKYGISRSTIQRIVFRLLKDLPSNNSITYSYCTKYSDILIPDGKYLYVKGYDRKISFLWGVDYFTHDFPIILLTPSESYSAWNKYFKLIKEVHSYKLIVCDDNKNLKDRARFWIPKISIQACYNHLKEGIRRDLKVRKDPTYREFMRLIEGMLSVKRSENDFNNKLGYIYRHYEEDDVARSVIINLARNKEEILGFRGFKHAPATSNLIECFNSHLEARLFSIKGFESMEHARLWLNGYVIKRRFTKFKDCTGKFKSLNGKTPLQLSTSATNGLKTFF